MFTTTFTHDFFDFELIRRNAIQKTHRFKTEKLRCYSNAKRRKQQWGGSGERMDVDLDVICAHLFINARSLSFILKHTHTLIVQGRFVSQ